MEHDADLAALADRFRFNERLLALESEGFTADDWRARPGERGGNAALWILAHVALHRRLLLRRLGDALPEEPWEKAVATGAKPTVEGLPEASTLAAAFTAAGERLSTRLPASGALAAQPWGPSALRSPPKDVRAGAHFLHFHETYHLGQIGLIRRLRGKAGFV